MRPFVVALLCCAPVVAGASTPDLPHMLVHSGRLLGGNDQPVSGTQTLTFRFFPDLVAPPGEKPLWTETYTVQVDPNGVYSVELGAPIDRSGAAKTTFPADLFLSGAAFLEVAVGDPQQTLSPRMRVGTVPYAMRSGDSLSLGGKDASQWQPKVTPAGPLTLDAAGNLAIGAANGSQAGALSASDWTTFNGKQDKLTPAGPLGIDGSANLTIAMASDTSAGALGASDWNTFNGKQDKLTPVGPVTIDGSGHLSVVPAKPGSAGLLASASAPLALDANGNLTLSTSGFIANGTTPQTGASLNIGGAATVGALDVNGATSLSGPFTMKNGTATRFAVDASGNATVAGTLAVNGSAAMSPAQTSGQATFEYPYQYTITVTGDPNTFYPVAMRPASNGMVPGKLVIARAYSETAPMTAFTPDSSHLGGLQAVFTTMNSSWADYSYLTLEHYRWTYVRTIADCGILPAATSGKAVWCRLRGGGFVYHLWANYDLAPSQPVAGSDAYNDPSGPYLFKYPAALPAESAPGNAFAPGAVDVPVSAL